MAKSDPSQTDRAEESILKGINIWEELSIKSFNTVCYLYLGDFYADTGQKDTALETLRRADGMLAEMGMDFWIERSREIMERL